MNTRKTKVYNIMRKVNTMESDMGKLSRDVCARADEEYIQISNFEREEKREQMNVIIW